MRSALSAACSVQIGPLTACSRHTAIYFAPTLRSYFPHIAGVISCEFPGASDQEGRLRDAEQIEELAL